MAWQFSPNVAVTGGNAQMNQMMKALISLGATCVGSGDGSGGTFENLGQTAGPYDLWTLDGSGPGGYVAGHAGNSNSWYRLRFPDNGAGTTPREMIVQRYGQYSSGRDDEWKLYWSKTGFLGNDASATLPPSCPAGDQIGFNGVTDFSRGGTSGFTGGTFQSFETGYLQIGAQDAADANGFFPFFVTAYFTASGTPRHHFMFEGLTDIAAGDAEPYVFLNTGAINVGLTASYLSRQNGATRGPGAWVNGVWQNVGPMTYYQYDGFGNAQLTVPRLQGINPIDSNERLLPCIIGNRNTYKGVAANIRMVPTAGRAYPDTYDNLNYFVVEALAFPWDGVTVPLV